MGFVTSGTVVGYSRSDGVTPRTVTMQRVGNVVNGFVLRETGVSPDLAQKVTYRTFETKGNKGLTIRHSQSLWEWPYELDSAPGVVAGTVQLNKSGLHVPANCPANVRADIRYQILGMASATAGSVGKQLVTDSIIDGIPAF